MKSLVSLHFQGPYLSQPSTGYIIAIYVNEHPYTFERIQSIITIWDKKPWQAEVYIKIAILDSRSCGLFTSKPKIEDLKVVQERKYRFQRQLNAKFTLDTNLNFLQDQSISFSHTAVECSTSDFMIIPTDPVLRTSPLCFFPVPKSACNIDLLMRLWNRKQISTAREANTSAHVHLLRIKHITPDGLYYETFLKRLDKLGSEPKVKDDADPVLDDSSSDSLPVAATAADDNKTPNSTTYEGLDLISFDNIVSVS